MQLIDCLMFHGQLLFVASAASASVRVASARGHSRALPLIFGQHTSSSVDVLQNQQQTLMFHVTNEQNRYPCHRDYALCGSRRFGAKGPHSAKNNERHQFHTGLPT
jgi:hypothetical protein